MRKIIAIAVILGAVLICFLLPFKISSSYYETVSLGVGIINGLSTFITLIIALILFNKFGIEKSILEKNSEKVFELLEEILKVHIWVNSKKANWHIDLSKLYYSESVNEYIANFENNKLIFNQSYFKSLSKIFILSDSIFMPKEIALLVKELDFQILELIPKEEHANYSKVVVWGDSSKEQDDFGFLNRKQINFKEYVKMWQDVIDTAIKWLSKNSSISPNLNIYTKAKNK